jgi:iron complex transport system substrate-binding protein
MNFIKIICLLAYSILSNATAAIIVQDDSGQTVTLQKPAERIISLSPGITELIFAAGGGDRLVGVIMFSDFPEEAKRIPIVGDSRELDLERIITLKPDLFVVWRQGISAKQIEQLRKLKVPLFFSDEQKLVDIPNNIRQLGQLMGTEKQANKAATELDVELAVLTKKYANVSPVRLFYQVWSDPLFTLNGQQIVSDAIRLCGGVNVFASQKITAPNVSIESVLQKNPEAIVGTNEQHFPAGVLAIWKKRYPLMTAVKQNNLFELDGHLINRAGPRMILGVVDLCEKLDQARKNRR